MLDFHAIRHSPNHPNHPRRVVENGGRGARGGRGKGAVRESSVYPPAHCPAHSPHLQLPSPKPHHQPTTVSTHPRSAKTKPLNPKKTTPAPKKKRRHHLHPKRLPVPHLVGASFKDNNERHGIPAPTPSSATTDWLPPHISLPSPRAHRIRIAPKSTMPSVPRSCTAHPHPIHPAALWSMACPCPGRATRQAGGRHGA